MFPLRPRMTYIHEFHILHVPATVRLVSIYLQQYKVPVYMLDTLLSML